MHSITKAFVIVKKFINQKNRKFKKNENRKNGPKIQNGKWAQIFFQAHNPDQKTKKK